jgi:hypothetical protein
MKKTPFKLKSGYSPLKQDEFRNYSDSLTVYKQSDFMNQRFNLNQPVTKKDYSVISDMNVKRVSEGLHKIYPVLQSGVTKEHDVTKNVNIKGDISSATDKDVIKQYKRKTKSKGDVTFDRSTSTLSVTTKSTEGYVIPKPTQPIVKLDPIKTVTITGDPDFSDVKLKKRTTPVNKERKGPIGRFLANISLPKYKSIIYGDIGDKGGFWKLKKTKGWGGGSKYKKLTKTQQSIVKSNKKIKAYNRKIQEHNMSLDVYKTHPERVDKISSGK